MKRTLILLMLCPCGALFSQVGVGTSTPMAVLDIEASNSVTPSNTDGFLIPRVSAFPVTNPTASQQGMQLYLTTAVDAKKPGFYYWDFPTLSWITIDSNKNWKSDGNEGTDPEDHFIGTTDEVPLHFRVNNIAAGRIESESSDYHGNVAFGVTALSSNTTGFLNVAVGSAALFSNTTGNHNTAVGYRNLYHNITGLGNVSVGMMNLFGNTVGGKNVAMGYQSLFNNTSGSNNVAIGNVSLFTNTTGSHNIASGYQILHSNTTGSFNIGTGYSALFNNTTGSYNIALGSQSLFNNSTGDYNIALGYRTLEKNTTGNNNISIGNNSLNGNISGNNNLAFGVYTLPSNTTGSDNIAIGRGSLTNNTEGFNNITIGLDAMHRNTTGGTNVAIGNRALANNSTGYHNTAIGHSAGSNLNGYRFNVTTLGFESGYHIFGNNEVAIGNQSTEKIVGQVDFSVLSDARIKDNVSENVPGLSFIKKLRPVTYNLNIRKQEDIVKKDKSIESSEWDGKYDIEKIRQTGFLAQEVAAAAKSLNYDFNGVHIPKNGEGLYAVSYASFVMPLVKAVQEQDAEIQQLKEKLKKYENLEARLLKLEGAAETP